MVGQPAAAAVGGRPGWHARVAEGELVLDVERFVEQAAYPVGAGGHEVAFVVAAIPVVAVTAAGAGIVADEVADALSVLVFDDQGGEALGGQRVVDRHRSGSCVALRLSGLAGVRGCQRVGCVVGRDWCRREGQEDQRSGQKWWALPVYALPGEQAAVRLRCHGTSAGRLRMATTSLAAKPVRSPTAQSWCGVAAKIALIWRPPRSAMVHARPPSMVS